MKKVLCILAILLVSACTTKTTYLSMIVPEGVQFKTHDLNYATVRKNSYGEDTNYILLFFPLGLPKFQTALNKALDEGHGNIMTNATIKDETKWFILFGYKKVEITGDVVNTDTPQAKKGVTIQ